MSIENVPRFVALDFEAYGPIATEIGFVSVDCRQPTISEALSGYHSHLLHCPALKMTKQGEHGFAVCGIGPEHVKDQGLSSAEAADLLGSELGSSGVLIAKGAMLERSVLANQLHMSIDSVFDGENCFKHGAMTNQLKVLYYQLQELDVCCACDFHDGTEPEYHCAADDAVALAIAVYFTVRNHYGLLSDSLPYWSRASRRFALDEATLPRFVRDAYYRVVNELRSPAPVPSQRNDHWAVPVPEIAVAFTKEMGRTVPPSYRKKKRNRRRNNQRKHRPLDSVDMTAALVAEI